MNTSIRHYELMYILSVRLSEKDIIAKQDLIKKEIEKISSKITSEIDMGIREMTYKIQGQQKGIYYVLTFNAESSKVNDIKAKLSLDTDILRYLLIKIPDDHIVSDKMAEKKDRKVEDVKSEETSDDTKKTSKKASKSKTEGESKEVKVKIRKRVLDRKAKDTEEKEISIEDEGSKPIKQRTVKKSENVVVDTGEVEQVEKVGKKKVSKKLDDGINNDSMDDLSKKIDDLLNNL